jgi:anti-sigma regulatory factor (Ser/Thr protein kinase)
MSGFPVQIMPQDDATVAEKQLALRSRLEDLKQVWPWVNALAAEYAFPADTRFAIDLCLEEGLSNIIRHGYAGDPDHTIAVTFSVNDLTGLTFTILDNAPHFAPDLSSAQELTPASIEQVKPGSLGIHLMKKFASTLTYEQLPNGNRLTIGFPVPALEQADSLRCGN